MALVSGTGMLDMGGPGDASAVDAALLGVAAAPECGTGDPFVDNVTLAGCLVLVMYVLYAFHVICDGYFVPALQLMCIKKNIPDVVAGATIMAAGASSPELITNAVRCV